MAKTRTYQHFCPVARALEVIGEKWSLLIVRDLLRGPQRFSDLHRYLGGITPKWLSLRLRELEEAGIVERDQQPGRREVWYRLTSKGQDLAPVVQSLSVWGMDHARRPPLPGEPIYPGQITAAVVNYLNQRKVRLDHSVQWVIRFTTERAYAVTFDGQTWAIQRGEVAGDVEVESSPEAWVTFLMTPAEDRTSEPPGVQVSGAPERVAEFLSTFGY